jgi:hypothetical protein
MKERGESNRSEVIEDLMVCWIHTDPKTGECSKDCPNYEDGNNVKKS